MLPYKVLGVYVPTKWDAEKIGKDLCDLTKTFYYSPHKDSVHGPLQLTRRNKNWCSVPLHAEVRHHTFKTTQAEGWHYDGDTTEGSNPNCLICVWSTTHPTEIRCNKTGKIYQPKPYEVVVFNNMECTHRRPPCAPIDRWTFRQRLTTTQTEIEIIETVFEQKSPILISGKYLKYKI